MNDALPAPPQEADEQPLIGSIEIRGFKSIRDATLPLGPLTVLIGPNGSGKSNTLEIFRFLNRLARGELSTYVKDRGDFESFLHFGPKITEAIGISIKLEGGENWYECQLRANDKGSFYFAKENCGSSGSSRYGGHISKRSSEIELGKYGPISGLFGEIRKSSTGVAHQVLSNLARIRVHDFEELGRRSGIRQTHGIEDNVYLHEDGTNLAAILYKLQKESPRCYSDIVVATRTVAPFFEDFVLEPSGTDGRFIRLRWKHRHGEAVRDVSELSSGTLRFICLATLLLNPNPPPILIFDEPELGLHPAAVTLLVDLIHSFTKRKRSQILVATQSVTFLNQVLPSQIRVVECTSGVTQFVQVDETSLAAWLDEYGMGDLWEKNLLGGRPEC